ncbi:MAG: YifB family Mg chelatase-like AAA ATPase [Legionella sp.]|nr:YifB family Mg chelatase-like AAA ATPase [Legionella sp.]
MELALSKTRNTFGIAAMPILVEVHLSNGLPHFNMVGLPATAVKESKDRVRSAIINSGFDFPCRKITVNLAPADLPKSGSGFDLAIAVGILAASRQIPHTHLHDHEFVGELALSGNLRGVAGILPIALGAQNDNRKLIIAASNADEASVVAYSKIFLANDLRSVCQYLTQNTPLTPIPLPVNQNNKRESNLDWNDVKGQYQAKHALEIAACGGHSVLLVGPPGSGKTMLAKRFNTLLPLLSQEQALESATIHSLRDRYVANSSWRIPPFRAPHHTASMVALAGGGNPPKPGEISLAHHGVLFLDELPEFKREVLETLREPLESGNIHLARASQHVEFPAQFQLIAAMNPCPCGQWGNVQAGCLCTLTRIQRYLSKLSGPLLDRIDMQIHVQAIAKEELIQKPSLNTMKQSGYLQQQVEEVRTLQIKRQGCLNAQLTPAGCESFCTFGTKEQAFLEKVMERLKLSARAYHRLLKVARTLADMKEQPNIDSTVLQQALAFKQVLEPFK